MCMSIRVPQSALLRLTYGFTWVVSVGLLTDVLTYFSRRCYVTGASMTDDPMRASHTRPDLHGSVL